MSIIIWKILCLSLALLFVAACSPTAGGEVSLSELPTPGDETQVEQGEPLEDPTVNPETTPDQEQDLQNPDAAIFAEETGLSLEEANKRLAFQETIGDIQPELMADLGDIYGGLWVENEPAYRIVIALTAGDETTIRPYIEEKAWAPYVEVVTVTYTLAQLIQDQSAAGRAADTVQASVTTAVDVIHNRVEVWVGNPELFQDALAEAGLTLPPSVVVSASQTDGELPGSNQGAVLEFPTGDGRTLYLPKQAPSDASMAALMEGVLVEVNGCLRLADDNYPAGFLVIWRNDADLRLDGDSVEVLDGRGQPIARVGESLTAGGGAIESPSGYANLDESIPGMPVPGCPGPYWIIAEMETLSPRP